MYVYGDRVIVTADKGTSAADIGIVQYQENDVVRVWWTVARVAYNESADTLEYYVEPTGRKK